MDIDNRIRKIAADVFFIDEERIVPGVDFMDDFGVDSLTIFEFVRSIEDEFNLDLNSLGLDSFRNLDNTCKVVASKL